MDPEIIVGLVSSSRLSMPERLINRALHKRLFETIGWSISDWAMKACKDLMDCLKAAASACAV